MKQDTIAAIATGMSNSGVGIVRISGEKSFSVIDKLYSGKDTLSLAESHTIHYGFIKDNGETIDEVLVMLMRGPRSFTGEDTIEIHCHGGTFVVKRVLETVLKSGVRPAEPGEFTKRAFLNGRIDLSQAEAVIDVINSKNEYALKSSVNQLRGSLKKKVENVRNKIIYNTAFIETALDDPEHISTEGYAEKLEIIVDELLQDIKKLLNSFDDGKIIKEGIQTVIVGKPNAGKSTLLNALSGRDRAIVTDIEGTTRDILEEQIQLQGLTLNMIDTAGIRETSDIIEKMGVDKAKEFISKADLILYVVDASRQLDQNDEKILELIYDRKSVILLNKSDLKTILTKENLQNELNVRKYLKDIPMIEISAKEEAGIKDLENILKSMFLSGEILFNEETCITNIRQKYALQNAYDSLLKVTESIVNQMPEDFYSIDLMDAYEALGSITGETIGEDLVNEIFSKFCMGK